MLLIDVIKACCSNQESEQYPVNLDALTMVSLLLVELVSPDVMYNGLPWPDEEFTIILIMFLRKELIIFILFAIQFRYFQYTNFYIEIV
ncbi:hypothetical protein M0802_000964 [Mischocyttarus mexicanus]|nr:hypothetical protein M0802_000964 [Mischocyttarus mexicanus]